MLERGKTNTVQLSNHMLEGRDSWLKWHRYYAQTLSPKIEQVCLNVKSLPFRLISFNEFILCTKWASCQVALTGLMQGPPTLRGLLGRPIAEAPIKEVMMPGACACRRT